MLHGCWGLLLSQDGTGVAVATPRQQAHPAGAITLWEHDVTTGRLLSVLPNVLHHCLGQMVDHPVAPLLQAVYDFWQYKLCDVFIELMKPVMRSGDAHAQQVTRETLYICLEVGLRSACIAKCLRQATCLAGALGFMHHGIALPASCCARGDLSMMSAPWLGSQQCPGHPAAGRLPSCQA